jgi:hypothetical protein
MCAGKEKREDKQIVHSQHELERQAEMRHCASYD